MRRILVPSFAVFAILASMLPAPAIPKQQEIPLSSASDEYAVILAVLRNNSATNGRGETIFVRDTMKVEREKGAEFAQNAKDLPKDLVRAFIAFTAPSEVVPVNTPVRGIRFVREADLGTIFVNGASWTDSYKKYPDLSGIVHVSLPMLDSRRRHALVYVNWTGGPDAERDGLYLYEKTGREWREAKIVELSIA